MDNFHYNKDDFIFISSWKQLLVQSNFDKKIKNDWCAKEKLGLFRYKYENLQVIKVPGKYGFLAVLNIDRGTKRRKPNLFDSTTEPFNNDLFNFTKIKPGEYLFQISNISNNNDILAINASPLGDYHSLILPKMNNKLPQVIDEYSLNIVIQCLLLSASPTIRIGFNSLCAFASVNHLHFHLYYLPYKMYLETCDIVNLSGPCYTIIDYPSKGFVFMLKSNELLFDFIKKVMILIDYLQKNNIPHNMYITRALYKDVNYNNCDDIRNCIRIFIWARTPSGEKNMDAFTPATCELFGHLVFKDNSQFIEVSEEKISKILTNVTESVFSSIKKDIKELVDYTLIGMVSSNCMKILPISPNDETEKKTHKIIVGDHDGIVQMFQIRKGKINMLFKTLPLEKITNVCLGGAIGTVQDKIFLSMGAFVRGYTKKGRMFLSFDTGLSEPIKCMYVTGNELLVSGKHVFNHFNDCKINSTYLCPELINCIITLDVIKMQGVTPLLACADLCIRILEGSTVKETFYLSSEPICLHLMKNNGGAYGNEVLVGLQNGHIVLLKIEKNTSVSLLWEFKSQSKQGIIMCIDCYEFNGEDHLLIGRQSGSVEVYSLQSHCIPIEKYAYSCSESVTSIQGGTIRNAGIPEIVVTTYTGWLFGLTFIDQYYIDKELILESPNIILNDEKQKVLDIRTEVSDLERQVTIERNKYLEFTQKSSRPSVLPYLAIKNTMFLDKENLFYHLIIELEATIDNVLLQCNCSINFIDIENNNTAVVSMSKCREEDNNKLLITYRCQLNTTKLELKMWSQEGDHGILTVYITPLLQPKSCQVCTFPIKPLLYHQRTNKIITYHPHSFLTLSGGFSLLEAHLWLSNCLPGIPEKPSSQENIEYSFKSVILDTILLCSYSRGLINIKTDNIMAIAIFKNNFSRDVTKKNIKLDMSYEISEASLILMIDVIISKLKIDIMNDKKFKLISAIKQLSVNPNKNEESLTADYLTMIFNEKKLKQEVSQRPSHMQRLQAIMLTLFDDWHKLKGLNIKPNSRDDLQEALHTSNSLDSIISLFEF